MWSASNAWRRPRVYAVMPIPTVNTPDSPRLNCWGATTARSRKKPIAWKAAMTTAMPPTVLHCAGVRPPLMRCQRDCCPTVALDISVLLSRHPGAEGLVPSDTALLLRSDHSKPEEVKLHVVLYVV